MYSKKPSSSDEIICHVLARFKREPDKHKIGMSRATLVIDENVAFLEEPLKEANFKIITTQKGLKDFRIKEELLTHRILVTKNTKDFVSDAPIFEYGIIGLEALPFIDASQAYKDNKTAKMISKAISDFDLVSAKSGFMLLLNSKGKHKFKRIE